MILKDKEFGNDGMMVFADCAVHPNPTAEELAEIAVATGRTTQAIAGFEPKIAMLSFSTKGSAKHEMVDKVVKATKLAQEKAPDLKIEGELQSVITSYSIHYTKLYEGSVNLEARVQSGLVLVRYQLHWLESPPPLKATKRYRRQ